MRASRGGKRYTGGKGKMEQRKRWAASERVGNRGWAVGERKRQREREIKRLRQTHLTLFDKPEVALPQGSCADVQAHLVEGFGEGGCQGVAQGIRRPGLEGNRQERVRRAAAQWHRRKMVEQLRVRISETGCTAAKPPPTGRLWWLSRRDLPTGPGLRPRPETGKPGRRGERARRDPVARRAGTIFNQ